MLMCLSGINVGEEGTIRPICCNHPITILGSSTMIKCLCVYLLYDKLLSVAVTNSVPES